MNSRLKIGIISYRSNPHCGGQGVYVKNLSHALSDLGHDVEVIAGPPDPMLNNNAKLTMLKTLDLYNPDNLFRTPEINELKDPVNLLEWLGVSTMGFPEPFTFGMRTKRYLSGKIKNPQVAEVNLGISIKNLVEEYGGGIKSDKKLKAVQLGGINGIFLNSDFLNEAKILFFISFIDLFDKFKFGGSISFLVEEAPDGIRGFFGSWSTFGVFGGILLGSAIASMVTSLLTKAHLHDWGWRLPFLLGAVIGVVGLFLRKDIDEDKPESALEKGKIPLAEFWQNYKMKAFKIITS
jgi:hypothetical protein